MKLSWHIQASNDKISKAESDFYVFTKNIGKQQ